MRKIRIYTFFVLILTVASVLLAGCGKKASPADPDNNKKETIAETKDDDKSDKKSKKEKSETDETLIEEESVDADFDELLGTYVYMKGNEEDERIYEISCIGGYYYIEYTGIYDYAGAELEVVDAVKTDKGDGVKFRVILYPFSGFSFGGDYWGSGFECSLIRKSNGDVIASEALIAGEALFERDETVAVHGSILQAERNTTFKELIGTWRCESERDGVTHEITLEFGADGTFKSVNKVQDEVPFINIGNYHAEIVEGDIVLGGIQSEAFAYGSMPYEWVIDYDDDQNRPVIYEDYTLAEPFTYYEEERNLPFKKIADGEKGKMTPGPGKRSERLEKMYEGYLDGEGGYECFDSDEYDEYEDEYLEDVIAVAYEYTKAPYIEVDSVADTPKGKLVTVHCYEIVGTGENEHAVTWDWIYYNVDTGRYMDEDGIVINID